MCEQCMELIELAKELKAAAIAAGIIEEDADDEAAAPS